MPRTQSRLAEILEQHEQSILSDWLKLQTKTESSGLARLDERQRKEESTRMLRLLRDAVSRGDATDPTGPDWDDLRGMLTDLSRSRAMQGSSPSETAGFIFSLKQPIFGRLRTEVSEPDTLADEIWTATILLDQLGLHSMEVFQQGREDVIRRQQQEMMELSTPVVQLWNGILALPLIGTLDSARTQVVMESLLEQIVRTGSTIAIIDITGVPTVDTLVAQHLLKTVAAARLMGAECIISGIRPQIAQTIVHLGVALGDVITKATLADAFAIALRQNRLQVVSANGQSPGQTSGMRHLAPSSHLGGTHGGTTGYMGSEA